MRTAIYTSRISLITLIIIVLNQGCKSEDVPEESIDSWYSQFEIQLKKNPFKGPNLLPEINNEALLDSTKSSLLKILLAQSSIYKGRFLIADSLLDEALENNSFSSIMDLTTSSSTPLMEAMYWKSINYYKQTHYEDALTWSNLTMELAIKNKDSTTYMKANKIIGNCLKVQKHKESAYERYSDCLNYFEKTQDSSLIVSTKADIANLLPKKDSIKIQSYFQEAADYYSFHGYHRNEARTQLNMISRNTLNGSEVINIFSFADSVYSSINDTYSLAYLKLVTGKWFRNLKKDTANAMLIWEDGLTLSQANDYHKWSANFASKLASIHFNKKQYDQTFKYDTLACYYAEKAGKFYDAARHSNYAADYLTNEGNLNGALKLHERASEFYQLHSKKEQAKFLSFSQISMKLSNEVSKRQKLTAEKASLYILLLSGTVVLLVMIILFSYSLIKRRRLKQKMLEIELKREYDVRELIRTHKYDVIKTELKTEERERVRLASELHDGVGSEIAGLVMKFSNEDQKDPNSFHFKDKLSSIYQDLRRISHNMGVPSFGENTLVELVSNLLADLYNDHGIKCKLEVTPHDQPLAVNDDITTTVYRILQELSINSIKHAHPSEFVVNITLDKKMLTILVSDDGKGFNIKTTSRGLGLSSIQNRINQHNGEFKINSQLNSGSQFKMEIPIAL